MSLHSVFAADMETVSREFLVFELLSFNSIQHLLWNRPDAAAAKVHKSSSKVGHNKLNLKVGTILGLS